MNICKLCYQEKELRKSHIIPKFVYQWMKKSGPGRLRQQKQFEIPIQDGTKERLLCGECENKLAVWEKWFSENVFIKYLDGTKSEFHNEKKMKLFTISILWRVLTVFIDDGNEYTFPNELREAQSEWRRYLLDNIDLKKFANIHLFFIPENLIIEGDLKNIHTYFHRSVDTEIAENKSKSFVYAKFSRFLFIGEIHGFAHKDLVNTNIFKNDVMQPKNQEFNDQDVISFMVHRASGMKAYSDLSPVQQQKITKYYQEKTQDILNSDYWKVRKKDL